MFKGFIHYHQSKLFYNFILGRATSSCQFYIEARQLHWLVIFYHQQ